MPWLRCVAGHCRPRIAGWLRGCTLLALLALVGAGCAAPPAAAGVRMVLTWHRPLPADGQALAEFEAQASRIAGVAVRQLAAVSGEIRVIEIGCAGAAQCSAAADRLRADPRVIALVDDRSRRPHGAADRSP